MAGDSIVDDLGAFLKNQRHTAQMSLRELATAAGVSNPYLSQIERGLRRPSADVLQQIAHGLQISATALYTRAGLLDDTSPADGTPEAGKGAPPAASPEPATTGPATTGPVATGPVAIDPVATQPAAAAPVAAPVSTAGVVSAIQDDMHLDPAQRRALIDVYSAFVRDGRTNQE